MPERVDLVEIASLYWRSAALNTAVSLGVFEALADAPAETMALAGKLGVSPPHLEALMDSLCGLGILTKEGGRYSLAPEMAETLDPASPDSLLPALRFNADLFGLWARLPDCVRKGAPVLPDNPHLGNDPDRTRRFVEGMHSRAGIMARGVLSYLRFPKGTRWLDVGGGPGTFSVKLLEQDPSYHATVLDLPPVVAAAAELHADNPVLQRLAFLCGDYHTTPFPGEQDLVLYCGALHQEPEADALALFKRIREALKPGGHLYVIDLMLDETRTQPVYSALFQLNMMLMRPSSRVYSETRLRECLRAAGFDDFYTQHVTGTPYTLVRATPEAS